MTRKFLSTVFAHLPDGAHFLVWTLRDRRSRWYTEVTEAVKVIRDLAEGAHDVYCGVALALEDRGTHRRTTLDDAAGIVGFVADVDFAGPDKEGYAPGEEEALAVIRSPGLSPSVIVNSGHGLQAWWLLAEPWMFDEASERREAVELSRRWQDTVRSHAERLGYKIDSVGDVTRVMRVPGTHNHKSDPVPVVLLDHKGPRFQRDDLEKLLVPDDVEYPALTPDLHVDAAGADFPVAKHEALLANVREYREAWDHQSNGLRDTSLSGYDMALCNRAAAAGWTPEEIAALIREHRKKYGDDSRKWLRGDYVSRTVSASVGRVRAATEEHLATQVIENPGAASRSERLRALGIALRIQLTGIQKLTGQEPRLRFWFGTEVVELPMERVVSQSKFKATIYALTGIPPRSIGSKEQPGWDHYLIQINEVAEVIDVGTDATLDGEIVALVRSFTEARSLETVPRGTEIERPQEPFLRDGLVWFRAEDIMAFAATLGQMRIERPRLLQRLRACGAERKTMATRHRRDPKKSSTASFYGLPQGVVTAHPEAAREESPSL